MRPQQAVGGSWPGRSRTHYVAGEPDDMMQEDAGGSVI